MGSNYYKVDEDSEIPIVNVGSAVRCHLKEGRRPREVYLRLSREVLEDIFERKEKEERFLYWLQKAVLPSIEKEKI